MRCGAIIWKRKGKFMITAVIVLVVLAIIVLAIAGARRGRSE